MSKHMRAGWLAVLLSAVGALAIAAGVGATSTAEVKQVGYASPEKPNDYGWNQQGYESAQKAAKAVGATVIAATGIGYGNPEPTLRRLAQRGADLIVAQASGYNQVAPKVAEQLKVPTLTYDQPKNRKPGIVANIQTSAQQGAYLAGVLAGQMTKTGTLGIVVSAADTNWYKQSGGFIAGARSIKKNLKFRYARIGEDTYADAAGGKRVTNVVIAAGADIVFGMGDGSSFGMMQAVQTAKAPSAASKVFFIDVIGNKTKIDKKGVLLSSVLWDFTPIFTQAIKDVESGNFGKKNYNLTVANGLGLLKTNKAPASAWAKVAAARKGVASGAIKIPVTATEGAVKKLCKC
jgi:simple sugar transport system substrate-binding protein